MSYIPLTLRYRPRKWSDLVGQEIPVRALTEMIKKKQLLASIILAGSRGLGKTTIARILARALNCPYVGAETCEPCGVCDICVEITEERSVAVQEMDAASHGQIDDVRRIKEEVRYLTGAKTKVYVVDEAHGLSRQAFDAFLKLLEEPPPNVMIVFCTTEVNRVPVTIVSRSLNLPFNRISIENIISRLRYVASAESISVDDTALLEIAKHANGGMRDAISMLDQLWSFSDGAVTKDNVLALVGSVNTSVLFDLTRALLASDLPQVYKILSAAYQQISDVSTFIGDLIGFYRDMMLVKTGLPPQDSTHEYVASIRVLAQSTTLEYLIDSQDKLFSLIDHIKRSPLPARSILEVQITKLLASGITATQAAKSTIVNPVVEQIVFVNPLQLAKILDGVILSI